MPTACRPIVATAYTQATITRTRLCQESTPANVRELGVESPLLPRIQAACDVEANDSVEHRLAVANAAQRAADFPPQVPIAGPAEISEERRPMARIVPRQLEPGQPERVSTLGNVGALPA